MNRLRKAAFALSLDQQGLVERAGPGTAPSAFRIWAAGENASDDGSIFFTQASAERLMAEQSSRGRVYSSDYDHLSLLPDRPATSGRASGWHQLEVRKDAAGAPELWATNIEWCADAKAGLEADPPLWRFFSPAFEVDEKGEVVSYVNFALCINPLTHNLPMLASKQGHLPMTKQELSAALAKICAAETSEEDRKAAQAALAKHFAEMPEPEPGEGNTSGEKKDPPKVEGETPEYLGGKDDKAAPAKAAQGGPSDPGNQWPDNKDKPNPAPAPPTEKTESRAAAAMGTDLLKANARIDALEIEALLAKHTEIPESLRAWCATQKPEVVRTFLAAKPKFEGKRNAAPVQGEDAKDKPVGLQGAELEELNKGMGILPRHATPFERVPVSQGGGLRIHTVRPSEARTLAAKGGK